MIECERRLFLLHGLRTRHREVAGPGVYPSSESSLLEMRGSVDLGSAPLLTLLLRPPRCRFLLRSSTSAHPCFLGAGLSSSSTGGVQGAVVFLGRPCLWRGVELGVP